MPDSGFNGHILEFQHNKKMSGDRRALLCRLIIGCLCHKVDEEIRLNSTQNLHELCVECRLCVCLLTISYPGFRVDSKTT